MEKDVKLRSITNKDGNVTLYLSGIKGGPVVSGINEYEAKKKFLNAIKVGILAGIVEDFIKNDKPVDKEQANTYQFEMECYEHMVMG